MAAGKAIHLSGMNYAARLPCRDKVAESTDAEGRVVTAYEIVDVAPSRSIPPTAATAAVPARAPTSARTTASPSAATPAPSTAPTRPTARTCPPPGHGVPHSLNLLGRSGYLRTAEMMGIDNSAEAHSGTAVPNDPCMGSEGMDDVPDVPLPPGSDP